ncbi:hypothetical protein BN988_03689 [Oceanobacillus picturae]|jgi:hypothetical protein|uniref:Uncharacterized protein n=1 Tax=Oceanobacillus picturae TaxID=171693 RepID=W9AR94_9BACI|nr:hypothetical protein [Oceanobacillus picturae]CDO05106.1 hypothetical protein BN988_03689 [Oceanobacillus picturae]
MRHPLEKIIRIELLTIALALVIGLISIIQGYLFLTIASLYLVAISFSCSALLEWQSHQTAQGAKHALRAFLIFLIATYLLFQL